MRVASYVQTYELTRRFRIQARRYSIVTTRTSLTDLVSGPYKLGSFSNTRVPTLGRFAHENTFAGKRITCSSALNFTFHCFLKFRCAMCAYFNRQMEVML